MHSSGSEAGGANQAIRQMLMEKTIAEGIRGGDANTDSLRSVRSRIDDFLAAAASAPPPVSIEGDGSRSSVANDAEQEIHINMLLGVIQARDPNRPQPRRIDGVILPGREAEDLLAAERMRDSEALVAMLNHLSDRTGESGMVSNRVRQREDADCEDDGSEVVIMDADDLSSSDDDSKPSKAAKRMLVEELPPRNQ